MEWIELDHSLIEWLLFIAAISILIAVKVYARKRRRMVAEQDAERRRMQQEADESTRTTKPTDDHP